MIGKRLLCLLGSLNLIITPVSAITTTPPSVRIIETQIDNNVVNKNVLEIKKHPIFEKLEKDKIEFEQKKAEEERLRKEQELEEQKKNEPVWQEFIVSFYTGLDEENSIYGAVNCRHLPLERGMVANNVLPYGTKIYLDNDFGTRTVEDTGSKIFNDSNRIDLYVARNDGETKEQWRKRAESYGIRHIWGYIIK